MEWLRVHRYASALLAAGALVLIGAFIVNEKSAAPSPSQTVAWSGGTLFDPFYTANAPVEAETPTIMQQVQSGPPYTYIPPRTEATPVVATSDGTFDFNAFIAMLSHKTVGGGAATTSPPRAYEFIPSGFISTTTPQSGRTALQQTLYDYGNDVGSFIQSFEQEHADQTQVLTNQAQDRADPDKAAAVGALGKALQSLGDALSGMDNVPQQMLAAHRALAKSYSEIGAKLALVPQAEGDAAFIAAVRAYDASADVFVRNYVALATLFSAYGVTFAQTDAGSVFTFSPAGL